MANYETIFVRMDVASEHAPRGRRRAKLALLATYHFRNRELRRFPGAAAFELMNAASWPEARQIIAFHRAEARLREAKDDLDARRLARFVGVKGTDAEGRPLDRREFVETKQALTRLHTFHTAQHKNGRYRDDLMTVITGLLSKTFPEAEIAVTVGPKGRSWWAWRRTVSGWVFGIGAAGRPPDMWTWDAPEPPDAPPGPGTDWTHAPFDESDDDG